MSSFTPDTRETSTELAELLSNALSCAKLVETSISSRVSSSYDSAGLSKAKSDHIEIAHLDAVIAQIEDVFKEVSAAFHRATSALARRRNASVSINTLPDEILAPIFVKGAGYNVLAIADTCTRWREVTIDCPEFWRDLPMPTSLTRARRLLSMAQTRGSPVGVTLPEDAGEDLCQLLSPVANLVQRLNITLWQGGKDWLAGSGTFSSLQELSASGTARPVLSILPSRLGQDGKLTSVSLQRCRMPYSPQCYRGLTTLRIMYRCPYTEYVEEDASVVVTDGSLTEVLQACPDLEELTLRWPPMVVSREPIFRTQGLDGSAATIPLLRLRRLRLDMFAHEVSALLTHMQTTPALISVHLTLTPPICIPSDAPYRDSLLAFSVVEHLPMLSTVHAISVCNVNDEDKTMAGSAAPTPFSINFDAGIERERSLTTAFNNFFTSSWLLHPHHALDNVRRLCLKLEEDMPRFSGRCLTLVSRAVRHVRTLALEVPQLSLAVELLNRLTRIRSASAERLLPGLDAIALVGCPLRHNMEVDPLVNSVKRLSVRTLSFEHCPMGHWANKAEVSRRVSADGLEVRWVGEITAK